MDPVLLVGIISGSSAIVASVGSQVVGALVSAKQAAKRYEWEREQWTINNQQQRINRNLEQNRAAFTHVTVALEGLSMYCRIDTVAPESIRGLAEAYPDLWGNNLQEAAKLINSLAAPLLLTAPGVAKRLGDLYQMVLTYEGTVDHAARVAYWQDELRPAIRACYDEMREEIGVEVKNTSTAIEVTKGPGVRRASGHDTLGS